MKGAVAALLLGSALSGANAALNLVKRDNPSVLGLPLERRSVPAYHRTRRTVKRGTVNVDLKQIELAAYFATVQVGTPAQTVVLDLDTGSSDMWVLSPQAEICANDGCSANGVYDPNKSSTLNATEDTFTDSYGDGSEATGPYVQDTIKIGGSTLENFQFGVATSYNTQVGSKNTLSGLLGIGYPGLEGASTPYKNLPLALASAGLINTPAYSLWLDDIAANKGQILFGGVNKAKYHGTLATLDIVVPRSTNEPTAFYVALTGLSITDNGSFKGPSETVPALLDSGSQYTTLAESDVEFILSHFNGSYDSRTSSLVAPCSLQNSKATVDFNFGAQVINVPVSELLVGADVDPSTGKPLADSKNNALCLVGLAIAGESDPIILGDTFLRSAYVVYDLFNAQVSIANTNFNSTTDDIAEITGSLTDENVPDVVPGATTLGSRPTASISTASRIGPNDRPTSATAVSGVPIITSQPKTGAAPAMHISSTAPVLITLLGMFFGAGFFMYI